MRSLLEKITGRSFYNLSKLDLPRLLDDPNQLVPNLNAYINGYSKNVREIMERSPSTSRSRAWRKKTCSMSDQEIRGRGSLT